MNTGVARRYARLRAGRCTCCTPKQIRAYYKLARMAGCDVDHVKPLALGGAHCLKNFQMLTRSEHVSKGRRAAIVAGLKRARDDKASTTHLTDIFYTHSKPRK